MAASRDLANLGDAFNGVSNVNIDSNTLFVDTVNNTLGIGTDSPTRKLDVRGSILANGNIDMAGWYSLAFNRNSGNGQIFNASRPAFQITATGSNTVAFEYYHANGVGAGVPFTINTDLSVSFLRAPQHAGMVLQTVHTVWTGVYSATSSTNVDFTGFNATFTPKYATSKVLVIVSAGVNFICDGVVYLKRNGTIVKDNWFGSSRADDQYDYPQATAVYLDSPGTTSTITYQVGGRAPGCTNTIRFGASDNSSSITMMEIAG